MEYLFPSAGKRDGGTSRKHFASHAEKQAAITNPSRPLRVDEPMYYKCSKFFQKLAKEEGQDLVVREPNIPWIFRHDKTRIGFG